MLPLYRWGKWGTQRPSDSSKAVAGLACGPKHSDSGWVLLIGGQIRKSRDGMKENGMHWEWGKSSWESMGATCLGQAGAGVLGNGFPGLGNHSPEEQPWCSSENLGKQRCLLLSGGQLASPRGRWGLRDNLHNFLAHCWAHGKCSLDTVFFFSSLTFGEWARSESPEFLFLEGSTPRKAKVKEPRFC